MIRSNKSGIWKYEALLPNISTDNQVTLGEGNTPLVKSRNIGRELGLNHLYYKLESANPTGSYKDRIAAVGVSWALEQGKEACIGTTSGNAGASIAAYAASSGLPYHLLVLESILEAKLMQVVVYDAQVKKIKGFGESAAVGSKVFTYIDEQSVKNNWEVLITAFKFNPTAMMGVKTISYELFNDFGGQSPDAVFIPVGGGGLFTGIAKGFEDVVQHEKDARFPSLVAVQSAGCSNIVQAWKLGEAEPVPGDSTSQISGLQVPNSLDGKEVLEVLNAGNGWGESVPDTSTWSWQERLASRDGILCEPASAITMAAVEQALQAGRIHKDSVVVCVISGAGYKDMGRVQAIVNTKNEVPLVEIDSLLS
ncbi:pyridoxal-phosphate dependent enzyme [Paenibacillus eucommiae]|uniref:Threonine synthase n=1 Tax=Paenibacillus eucommiae TaxID=1355755 RepID=A0ABS4IPK7_9BACL|nr:pyridoxal-phosphate dependent enzyme [Paenibacillus eucommiae]MBP1988559.1 threonine synthase [Paenibacillus eucommiae]